MKIKSFFRRKVSRRGKTEFILMAVVFVIFLIYALTLIYPFVWAFLNSLKSSPEFYDNSFALPKEWMFSNYADVFSKLVVSKSNPLYTANLVEMFFNSIWFTAGIAALGVITSTLVAYALTKYEFPGRNVVYAIAVFVMIIPIVGSMPAYYKLVYGIKIANSPLYLITATSGIGLNFIVMYGFFKNVSWSYAEAGFIDGASNWQVLLFIMIPQAKPAIFSLFIIAAINVWNDYLTPLLYLRDFPTLSTGLFVFKQSSGQQGSETMYFAGVLISLIPILALFLAFQETIMSNTVAGGLKG